MKFKRLIFICLLLAILTIGAVSADDNITEPVAVADENPVAIADENPVGDGNSAPEIGFAMPEKEYVPGEIVYFATDINNGIVDVSVDGNPREYGYLDDVDEVSYGYYINSTDLAVGNHTLGVKITNDTYYRDSFFNVTFSIKEIIVQVKEDADLELTPRVSVHLPYDATGELKVTCNGNVTVIKNHGCLRVADLSEYLNASVRNNINPVVVTYTGDEKYGSFNRTYKLVPKYEIYARDRYETIGQFSENFYFSMPDKVAIDKMHALVDGEEYEVKWDGYDYYFDMSNIKGKHNVTIIFDGDDRYYPSNVTRTINLIPEIEWYCTPSAGSDAKVVIPTYGPNDTVVVQMSSSKDEYTFKAVAVNGVATVLLSKVNYGSYKAWTYVYYGDSYDCRHFIMTIDNSKLTAGDMTKNYGSSAAFKVKVTTSKGKIVKNQYVKFYINGKYVKKVKTTKNGYATLKINKAPGSYKISAKYGKVIITRNLNVKHVVTLKTVAVKKSVKSLTLKATLKQGKKALKYKKVTFKFNGKTYKAKTNKYGVAKVTIKKAVLKKLKVGKNVAYQATYLKDTVKKSVKVKK